MSEEDFRQYLVKIDNLFCEIQGNNKRFVCRSKKTSLNLWKISCTDILETFWEIDLEYKDVLKHKDSIGLGNQSFETYFTIFCTSFEREEINVNVDSKNYLSFNVLGEHNGLKIFQTYRLHPAPDFGFKITRFVFDLVSIAKKHYKYPSESLSINGNTTTVPFQSSPKKPAVSIGNNYKSTTETTKRKVGHSLMNPNAKRRIAKGAKIGGEVD